MMAFNSTSFTDETRDNPWVDVIILIAIIAVGGALIIQVELPNNKKIPLLCLPILCIHASVCTCTIGIVECIDVIKTKISKEIRQRYFKIVNICFPPKATCVNNNGVIMMELENSQVTENVTFPIVVVADPLPAEPIVVVTDPLPTENES